MKLQNNLYSNHLHCIRSLSNTKYSYYWKELIESIEKVSYKVVFPGNVHAYTLFLMPYPNCTDFEVLILAFIELIERYAYQINSSYKKITIGYTMVLPTAGYITVTLCTAIPLNDLIRGHIIQKKVIYEKVAMEVRAYGEKYQDAFIKGVFINVYYEHKDTIISLDGSMIPNMLDRIIKVMESDITSQDLLDVRSLKNAEHSRIPDKINALRESTVKKRSPFIVADIETVFVNNVHVPYAAGFLTVEPTDDLTRIPNQSISTYFSEDHLPLYPNFEERSYKLLYNFLSSMEDKVMWSEGKLKTVYFHNLARFDGIIILKHYTDRGIKVNTIMRNNMIYELRVNIKNQHILRFRDSCLLLPSPLASLGKTLCPELGPKGTLQYADLTVSDLQAKKDELIKYLRQDILILGGVMLKAQEINWGQYRIDINMTMTISSLALRIFRQKYFDDKAFHINIPNRLQDTFIRRGYYGGHVDVYKPYGENLYYYDVNSLYPFIMKSYPMPSGVPVWKNNLESVELESLFGFIEAIIVCPCNMDRPFLPYKDEFGTLIFPTGEFTGVYYSEELKFAHKLGYKITPLRGYIFEKKSTPFEGFIKDLYESRMEAKRVGNEPMTWIYKILMNSLYGRFGINPISTMTEICDHKRYEELMKKDSFITAEKLTDTAYIVNYQTNTFGNEEEWKAPKMLAVHLSAAITACARIYMYPYLSRKDCYYTDTDSIVLGSPLPFDMVSSVEMGKFKLESKIRKGIFLAPKSYMLETEDDRKIMKHKGPAKEYVTAEWFQEIIEDRTKTSEIPVKANFRIDWKQLRVVRKDMLLKLRVSLSTKRENVYNSKDVWVGTKPKHVINLGNKEMTTIYNELMRMKKNEPQSNTHSNGNSTTSGNESMTVPPILYKTKADSRRARINRSKKDSGSHKCHKPKPDS